MNSEYLLNRTVEAAAYPVTVDEVKSDLRIQHTSDDTRIAGLIAAATDFMDVPSGAIGKALINQTWALSVESYEADNSIIIPITPVSSIISIQYFDVDNVSRTLTVSDFHLYGNQDRAWIKAKNGIVVPSVFDRLDAITVTFVAGFGASSTNIPNSIRQAISILIAHWYENPTGFATGANVTELPFAVQSLINLNRKGWVA
mgnify:CR=1 FL=1|tara:strand:+ start:5370 stop:5972 length:603 start_codon:yes stop_codon:yes gene_type:complete